MANESSLVASVGLRHIIEDGISILSNGLTGDVNSERRKYVLEDLTNLLQEAMKGSDLAKQVSLFVRSDERSAFETFLLLDRYLGYGNNPNWRETLPVAKKAFDQLKKDAAVSPETRSAAITLLTELLSSVKRQNSIGIPEQPEDIQIFG